MQGIIFNIPCLYSYCQHALCLYITVYVVAYCSSAGLLIVCNTSGVYMSREKTLIIIKILKHFYCGVVIYNAMNYNETRVFHSYFTVISQTLQGAPVQYFHQACLDCKAHFNCPRCGLVIVL